MMPQWNNIQNIYDRRNRYRYPYFVYQWWEICRGKTYTHTHTQFDGIIIIDWPIFFSRRTTMLLQYFVLLEIRHEDVIPIYKHPIISCLAFSSDYLLRPIAPGDEALVQFVMRLYTLVYDVNVILFQTSIYTYSEQIIQKFYSIIRTQYALHAGHDLSISGNITKLL